MKAVKAISSFFRSKYLEGKTMKLQMLVLSVLLATVGVQAEEAINKESLFYGGLPDKSVKITHLAALKKRFYNSSPVIKDFLNKTILLEQLADRSIHILDLSMQLTFVHIEYYMSNSDLDGATRNVLDESYAEIVTKLLEENPEIAERLVRYKKEKDEELGIHVVKVWIEGQGEVDMIVGRTSTFNDGDRLQVVS
jgi:hypothetical protein